MGNLSNAGADTSTKKTGCRTAEKPYTGGPFIDWMVFPLSTPTIPTTAPAYNASTSTSDSERSAFIDWLTAQTVAELQAAHDNEAALHQAVKNYVQHALAAELAFEDIEEILGINEPCIMDLAELSEADEEAVVDAFEDLCNA
jgi:hypothetical protein